MSFKPPFTVVKKKIAVVGYGGQGAWHASWAEKSDVVSLAGIYDIKESRMAAARAAGIHTYSSFEELIADEAVDIVVCATPNDVHRDIVVDALLAGKNVVCEKPVALSLREYEDMVDAAKKSGKVFTVHQNRRWDVDFLAIKNLISTGEIGEAINIESRIHGSRGIPSDWRCHKPYGGGMILDWGVHLIDQMLQLIPEKVVRVYCELTNITTDEVDDGFNLHLTFESGKRATIEVGTYNFIAMPRFYMQAKGGSALIEDWQKKCRVSRLKAWNEKEVLPVQTAAGITKTMAPRDELTLDFYEIERPASDVHDFYRNLCLAIDGKAEQLITHDEVRRSLKVMLAAFESGEGHVVLNTNI
ncbi:MAG: Gfo/Idh/MocA family oxidoreductase [Clostridia bacterium]|nr:Gfo/Idh/MocA family oxidoreductase [Clostridia bacterium]MBQ8720092.1 Gfo/Idh/MocA family oxidoreductase [Clostridia bacterium]